MAKKVTAKKRWTAPKGGRKRAEGKRHPGGQLVQAVGMTPEMLARRIEAVGMGAATGKLAGYALGRLLATEQITKRQHDAGLIFAQAWRHWRGLAGLPPRTLTAGNGGPPRPDCTAGQWAAARSRLYRCYEAMGGWLPVKAVDGACCDDEWPVVGVNLDHLRQGLTALAEHFSLGEGGRPEAD